MIWADLVVIWAGLPPPQAVYTGYTRSMAKVMISMPDELLARIDAQVKSEHATRSEFLRRLAEQELAQEQRQRRKRIEGLLDAATGNFGGDGAKLIREDRESH
jgi:metal-responsive CopG/Arc/MetJ family transcriptional regulator